MVKTPAETEDKKIPKPKTATELPKRDRGRPPKLDYHDVAAIKLRIIETTQQFSATCAEDLRDNYKAIRTLSRDSKAPLKDRMAALKYCIDFAEQWFKDNTGEYEAAGSGEVSKKREKPIPKKLSIVD